MFEKELREIEQILKGPSRAGLKLIFQNQQGREISSAPIIENPQQDKVTRYQYLIDRLAQKSGELIIRFPDFRMGEGPPDEKEKAKRLIKQLMHERPVKSIPIPEFKCELYQWLRMADSHTNNGAYLFFMSVAGWHAELKREPKPFGYHFHYIETRRGKSRTNVIFTFDPSEVIGPPDTLYWEYHSAGLSVEPEGWSPDRCEAIHKAAQPSIDNPGKRYFRKQSHDSRVLFCR